MKREGNLAMKYEGLLIFDTPLNEKDKLLPSFQGLVDRIVGLLRWDKYDFPILINGDWGAGKTSVLKSVQHELSGSDLKIPTIWFDAWHYEKTDGLLPALLRSIWEQHPDKEKKEKNKKTAATLIKSAYVALTRSFPAVLKAFNIPLLPDLIEVIQAKGLKDDLDALKFEANEPPPDTVRELRDKLLTLIKGLWGEDQKVRVFIDDLDRCSPEGAVELLEAIRMLVVGSEDIHCRFVVGLDRNIMMQAIAAKFSSLQNYDGNRYLEKIFPLVFNVPTLDSDEAATIVNQYLSELSTINADERDILTETLSSPSFANPRLMKRSINKFSLLRSLKRSSENDTETPDFLQFYKTICEWIVATERWPRLRHLMQQRKENYWDQMKEALEEKNTTLLLDPDAAALINEPGALAWMQNVTFLGKIQEFTAAEDELRRLGL